MKVPSTWSCAVRINVLKKRYHVQLINKQWHNISFKTAFTPSEDSDQPVGK